uniref:Dihydrofolate reductase n=1 Tax=uncultured bacterium contig00049 TaxID=1181534 RepID=A0A806KC85_9BACT|nr:dihydrofolate reductase [uncultured bacterium contig00049]
MVILQDIIIIAAMAENRVIGKDNKIPWSIKEDMAHFRELTKGCPCIMGRKTWESLPKKPLPGRLNIVVSQTMTIDSDNVKVFPSLQAAIEFCSDYEKIFICGGETIYKQALPLANKLELTIIRGNYEGDTFFPEIDLTCWKKINTINFDTFSFITYTKNWVSVNTKLK